MPRLSASEKDLGDLYGFKFCLLRGQLGSDLASQAGRARWQFDTMQDGSLIALSGYVLDADTSDASPVNDACLCRQPMDVAWQLGQETALSEKDLNAIGCFEGPTSSPPQKSLYFVRQDSSSPFSSLQKKKVYPPTDCKHKSLSCFGLSKRTYDCGVGNNVPIGTSADSAETRCAVFGFPSSV
jgi:hypothetical protein